MSCLLLNLPEFRTGWLFAKDKADDVVEVPVRGDIVISNVLALRDAALAGLGPTLLADWLVRDDLRAGRLVDLYPGHRVTATSFDTGAWLVYPSRRFLPRRTRLTIDFLRSKFLGMVAAAPA